MRRLLLWTLGAAAVLAMMVIARLSWAPGTPTPAVPATAGAADEPAQDTSPLTGSDPFAKSGPVPPAADTDAPPTAPQLPDGEAPYRQAAEELAIAMGPADKSYVMQIPQPFSAKGIYLTGDTLAGKRFDELMDLVERTELNAMVIDVKNDWGGLNYCSQLPNVPAKAIKYCIRRMPELIARLNEQGIYTIARIVAFKDNFMPEAHPDLGVHSTAGGLWQDRKQQKWLNPYKQESWDYVLNVAREAAAIGFKEIQFDYVRFPTDGNVQTLLYPDQDERTRWEVISQFLAYAREELHKQGVVTSADIFGYILAAQNDQGIGQLLETLAPSVDIISPMIYPSHWGPGNLGLPNPNADPYETVLRSMRMAQERLDQAGIKVVIRPWLQDFTLGPPPYTAEHVRAQIEATYDAGLDQWLLWNAGNHFTEDALLRAP